MSALDKKDLVVKLLKEHEITAYEIGNNTNISALAAQNIIDGNTSNPRNKTLNIILDYIEEKITGSDLKGHANYREKSYKPEDVSCTDLHRDSAAIIRSIETLKTTMERNQNIMATSLADLLLDTSEIKDDIKELQGPLKDLVKLHNTRAKIGS